MRGKRIYWVYRTLLFATVLLNPFNFFGQEKKPKVLSGVIGSSIDVYDYSSTDTLFRSSYLPVNYRVYVNANLQLHKKFSLPFSFTYSKRQLNTVLPQLPKQKPLEYIQDPRNNIGFHPTYKKWATIHLGTHTPSFSELSTGNTPIFGIGFDLKPKKIRIAGSYGYTNLAVEHDTFLNSLGAYKRLLTAFKIGLGKEENSNIGLNIVKARDVIASIGTIKTLLTPEEGIVGSLDYKIKFSKTIKLYGEIAGSMFSNNQIGGEIEQAPISIIPKSFFEANETSRIDASAFSSLDLNYKYWGIVLTAKQIGAGYKSLSFPYMLTDYRDLTLSPRFMLLKNKVILNGTVGYRMDNISETKTATNSTLLLNSSIALSLIKNLGFGGSYSNFGQENTIDNDTLKVNFISESYNVYSNYKIKSKGSDHILNMLFGRNIFNDLNQITGARSYNNTRTLGGGVTSKFKKIFTNVSYINSINKQFNGDIKVNNIQVSAGYKIKKKKIDISCGISYQQTQIYSFTKDLTMSLKPKIRWMIDKKTNFQIASRIRQINFGDRKNNSRTNDIYISTGLTKRF